MPSFPARILLFVSSYFPLVLIFGLTLYSHSPLAASLVLALGLASLAILWWYLHRARRFDTVTVTAEIVRAKDAEAMSYIVTYVIPFIDLAFGDWKKAVSLGIFILTVSIIYINSNMIHINPMLNMFGYHILEIESGGISRFLISRRRTIPKGSEITVHRLGNELLLEALG